MSEMKRQVIRQRMEMALPFFQLLGDKGLKSTTRKKLLSSCPLEFHDILSQMARHLLNGSFCINKDTDYCKKYHNSLYLLALPETSIITKRHILFVEDPEFILEIANFIKSKLN